MQLDAVAEGTGDGSFDEADEQTRGSAEKLVSRQPALHNGLAASICMQMAACGVAVCVRVLNDIVEVVSYRLVLDQHHTRSAASTYP